MVETREEYVRDNVNAAARGQLCGTTLIRPRRPQGRSIFVLLQQIALEVIQTKWLLKNTPGIHAYKEFSTIKKLN